MPQNQISKTMFLQKHDLLLHYSASYASTKLSNCKTRIVHPSFKEMRLWCCYIDFWSEKHRFVKHGCYIISFKLDCTDMISTSSSKYLSMDWNIGFCYSSSKREVQDISEDSSSGVANPKPCHLTLPSLSSKNICLWLHSQCIWS